MKAGLYRFLTLQLTGAALLAVSQLYYGALARVWAADGSHLVAVIAAAGLAGLAAIVRGDDESYRLARHFCVGLGIVGTVYGFIGALAGIDPVKAADPAAFQSTIAAIMPSLGIALYTTLVGMIAELWLALSRRIEARPVTESPRRG